SPATLLARPSRNSRPPLTLLKRSAAPDRVLGSRSRASEYTTSSEVISRPLWKRTPFLSVNVHVSPSRDALQNSASAGATVSGWSATSNASGERTRQRSLLGRPAVGGTNRLEELSRTRRPGLDHRSHQQERHDRRENRQDLRHDSLLELLELRKPSP